MASTDLAIQIATTLDATGLNKADKSVNSLSKSVSKLARYLGPAVLGAAVIKFGKASVKAFAEDQKAATRLSTAVKNLGLALEQPSIDRYIAKLESTTGVLDDQLRPAFQALLTTTGSVAQSQKILSQAIDISRGSGIELTTVTQDLANAYVGNTKGLKKYNTGLTAAQLKAASFEEIQRKLNGQFSGASATYLATYSGKMDLLTTAADNAKETIGKGLVDALSILGSTGTSDIQKATSAMDDLATSTANVIRGNAVVLSNLGNIGGGTVGKIGKGIKTYFKEVLGIQALEDLGKATLPKPTRGFVSRGNAKNVTILTKAEKDAAKNAKELATTTKKNTDELKKQAALKKAGTVFDLEQIGIVAALKGKLSEEEKIRLQAQLALLNGNADVATRLTNQILAAQDSTGNLAKFLSALPNAKNPFEYLDAYLSYLAGKAAAVLTGSAVPNVPSTNATAAPMPTASEMAASGSFSQLVAQGAGASGGFSPVVAAAMSPQVIELKITGDGDLTNTIAKNLMQQSLSTGNQTYVNRRTGGFE